MWTANARADQVSAHLTYLAEPGLDRCPTARELTDAVAARLGYDPFAMTPPKDGPVDVVVTVKRQKERVVGKLVLGGAHGGERVIESSDCREAVDALAVAVAIGIDPSSLAGPTPEPPPPPPPPVIEAPPPPPPLEKTEPAPPPARSALQGRVVGGVAGFFGELPNSAAGLAIGASLRWRWLEPTIDGFASFAASKSASEGSVSASIAGAILAPCVHVDPLFGCVTFTLGNFHGDGQNLAVANHADEFYSAVGARIGAELRIAGPVFGRLAGEVDAPATKISLHVDDREIWSSPRVALRIGLSLGVKTFE